MIADIYAMPTVASSAHGEGKLDFGILLPVVSAWALFSMTFLWAISLGLHVFTNE
ncbi:hypothetical protein TIFTF001_000311 [Ficus carica]|uniref:Uncharacterized protein n=1 Tax=Ficus carica TaxID=3494 RepID=A0AA87YV67_FICCA|nr:hypothetical protein TIFTF001_000311 [Ficus carica]